jgi:hypothetical protein
MKRTPRLGLFLVALAGGIALSSIFSFGTVQIAQKEKKACTVCHVKVGSKELNDVGKCYQKHKSLKGCESGEQEGKKQ